MFKHIILLSSIIALTACSSINQKIQCEPNKNYVIISDEKSLNEFIELDSKKDLKSIYYKFLPVTDCNNDGCIKFNHDKYSFMERNFSDGIYSIFATSNIKNKKCFKTHPVLGNPDICYYSEKNNDNKIKSLFTKEVINEKDYQSINILKNNSYIYKSSRQIFRTGYKQMASVSYCPLSESKMNKDINILILGE